MPYFVLRLYVLAAFHYTWRENSSGDHNHENTSSERDVWFHIMSLSLPNKCDAQSLKIATFVLKHVDRETIPRSSESEAKHVQWRLY